MRNSRPHTHTNMHTLQHTRMCTTIMIMLQLYLRRGESFGLATKFIYIHKLLFLVHLLLLLLSSSIISTLATLHSAQPYFFHILSLSRSLFEFPFLYAHESTWKFTTICEFIYYQHIWNANRREQGKNYDMHTVGEQKHRAKHIWIGWPHFILLTLLFITRAHTNEQLVGGLAGW